MMIKKLGPLGAEIVGINLTDPLDVHHLGRIKEAFLENLVLIFRGIEANPKNLLSIARKWGNPQKHPVFKGLKNYPEIIQIENYGKRFHTNAHWHSDVTFEEFPPDITLLYALEIPKKGGNTLFSNQYLAYEFLPESLKKDYKNFKAKHSNRNILKLVGKDTKNLNSVSHPLFRTHFETNKIALYVTEAFVEGVEGMDEEESNKILDILYSQSRKVEYRFEHKWKKGDLVMWDNRCVQHYAVHDYDDQVRTMYRITIRV